MKIDKRLLIKKLLLITLLLIVGNETFAQHPLLSDDELEVYVIPGSTVTLGKQAYDEGRTCYKWEGCFPDGQTVMFGSKIVFDLPEFLHAGSSCTYWLTVIGEQYYQQKVILHVIEQITFTVTPLRGCYTGNEMPRIEEFKIETNPSGFEDRVELAGVFLHTPNVVDGKYDVLFVLRYNNSILDQQTAMVIKTDDAAMNYEFQVPLDNLAHLASNVHEAVEIIRKGLKAVPGWYGDADAEFPAVFGDWTMTIGYDCCDKKRIQIRMDVDNLGIKADLYVDGGFNFVLGKAFLRGEFELDLGLHNVHVKVFNTCDVDPPIIHFDLTNTLSIGAYVQDFTEGRILSAYARFALEMSHSYISLEFVGSDYAVAKGSFSIGAYFEARVKLVSLFEPTCKLPIAPNKTIYVNVPIKIN